MTAGLVPPPMFDRQRHALALGLGLLTTGAVMAAVVYRDPGLQRVAEEALETLVVVLSSCDRSSGGRLFDQTGDMQCEFESLVVGCGV